VTTRPVQVGARKCQGCGYQFIPDGDQWYCSVYCERPAAMAQVYGALQRLARQQLSADTRRTP
jgi:hypothetical protein